MSAHLSAAARNALRAHLAAVAGEACAKSRPLLATFSLRGEGSAGLATTLAPEHAFAAAAGRERCYWATPDRGLALAGVGTAAAIESCGHGRFAAAARAARALFADVRRGAAPGAAALPVEAGPLLLGGFAFAPEAPPSTAWAGFPALRFVLPELAVVQRGGARCLGLALRVEPGMSSERLLARAESLLAELESFVAAPGGASDAPPGFAALADRSADDYRAAVGEALDAIGRGELEKVVLARACTVSRRDGLDPARVLAALRALHPGCFVFAVGRGEACFVGASPERLLRREGDRVLASALAGSAPRGRTPEEDARLGRALRESKKEQAEHAVVRRAVTAALAPACERLDMPEAPELLRLDGIQHLHTRISGTLRAGAGTLRADAAEGPQTDGVQTLLSLAGRLHPTPAVGGAPRGAALAFLTARERLIRGWYAGGVGWLAPSGDGELAVALRCALLRGRRAVLYAGAGIVAGSDPEAELAETRLKLRAALAALVEL